MRAGGQLNEYRANPQQRAAMRWLLWLTQRYLLLIVGGLGWWITAAVPCSGQSVDAEQPSTSANDPAAASGQDDEATAARALSTVGSMIKEDPSTAPTPSVMQRVDHVFSSAVSALQTVLFYRIGQREQAYLQLNDQRWYVRATDDGEPFQLLTPDGLDPSETLEPADINRLEILGKLVPNDLGEVVRLGRLDGRSVEFVVVQRDSAKYVWKDGAYRRELGYRNLLSDEDTLTKTQAAEKAATGLLKLDRTTADDSQQPAYRLTERVGGVPLVVAWLAIGAIYFTIYMRFVNFWAFRHAIQVVRGKYDNPEEPGEVTHFQALASALSATVGLGNIAGVTVAMQTGGPGAFFWMLACGFFGMTSKFVECTLGQRYRRVKEDGTVLGGPMQYLSEGLGELGLRPLGMLMAYVFAVMCIMASFGGGNMFQANQSGQQMLTMFQMADYDRLESLNLEIKQAAAAEDDAQLNQLQAERTQLQERMDRFANRFLPVFGIILASLVALVIIGGIKRIGAAASRIVPSMCLIYLAACLWIILNHATQVPSLVAEIFTEAFRPRAFGGGLIGVLVIGVQRAAFSNEAGVGSAAIAHSAARTEEPVREGVVAMMGPFIDTIVVCSMTALVILITGAWNNEAWVVQQGLEGTPLTSKAFAHEISFFPYILSVAVVLFAYSTIVSWSYYGERCWERLFGARSIIVYRLIYVGAVFLGAIVNLGAVLDFSDMMILSMAFPNVAGLVLLCPKVRNELKVYWRRLHNNEFRTFN